MEKDIEIQDREAVRKEKELDATVKKQADADLYRRQQEAEAEKYEKEARAQADAEKLRLEAESDAAAKKARAEAEAEADRVQGLADAEVAKAKGQAEADVEKAKQDIVRAKGEAEAQAERARIENVKAAGEADAAAIESKGLAETRVLKEKAQIEVDRQMGLAEAMLKAGELKSIELIMAALPQIAGKIAEPFGNVDKITIVDTGNGEGMNKMVNTVTNVMHTLPNVVEDMSGINLGNVLSNLTKGRLSNNQPGAFDFGMLQAAVKQMDPDTLAMIRELFLETSKK
jgi:flotillin